MLHKIKSQEQSDQLSERKRAVLTMKAGRIKLQRDLRALAEEAPTHLLQRAYDILAGNTL